MLNLDSFQEILFTLKKNKLRSTLTAFGVFWGIFMLILLLGAGEGLKNGVAKNFSSDVRTSIWVWTSTTSIPYLGQAEGRQVQLTEADVDAIKSEVKGVQYVIGEAGFRRSKLVTYGKKSGSYDAIGVSDDYFKIKVYQDYRFGRRIHGLDNIEGRKVVSIGTKVAERLFDPGVDPIGHYVSIQGISFRIVGVFYDSGWQGRMSERLYIPLSTYQKTFGESNHINNLGLTPLPGYDGSKLTEDVKNFIKERHRIAPTDRKAVFANNLAEETKRTSDMFSAISLFIWFVGIGTLMAGIVGISNIMIITVKERTPEIGVRKALGATPVQIVATILLESVLITSVAGYTGLVLGVGLLELVNFALESTNANLPFFSNPTIDFNIAISAIVILITIGTLAGFLPAVKAARISPVEAMRAK